MRALLAIAALVLVAGAVVLWLAVRRPATTPADAARPRATDASPGTPAATTDGHAAVADDTAVRARAELFATLRASGGASETWSEQGLALLGRARAAATSDVGCFVAGCGAVFTYASQTDYAQQRAALEASPEYAAWTGGKRWTDVEQLPDGRARVGLLLYRPD